MMSSLTPVFFFFNDTATTEIYPLSLHDPLPIFEQTCRGTVHSEAHAGRRARRGLLRDRKSTRLNSSHANISYAVFCLKKNNYLRSFEYWSSILSPATKVRQQWN